MMRTLGLGCALILAVAACGGDDSTGGDGTDGTTGTGGTAGPAGAAGAAGPAGADGKPSDAPTILSMVPALVFPGRPASLVVNALGTDWQAGTPPTVELGAGVSVDSVQVTGTGTLLVSVRTDTDVEVGLRAVSIGGLAFGGFGVASALRMDSLTGPVRNGSVQVYRLSSQDPAQTLGLDDSLATDAIQLFRDGARVLDGIAIFSVEAYSTNDLLGLMLVDGDAAAGAYDVNLIAHRGTPPLPQVVQYGPDALHVEHVDALVAPAFPFVTPVQTQYLYNSKLFSFVAATSGAPTCTASLPPGSPATLTSGVLYANQGNRNRDTRAYVAQGDTVHALGYVASVDSANTAEVSVSFGCSIAPYPVTNEVEPNDTTATGMPIVGGVAYHGSIVGADRDVYTFTSGGSVSAKLNGSANATALTMRFLDSGANEIAKLTAAPQAASGAVAVPVGAASIEIYADAALVPAQAGGTYELLFTP